MKGNIGLFISGGKDITGKNITIDGIINRGTNVDTSHNVESLGGATGPQASASYGILQTASENITFTNSIITNITSENNSDALPTLSINT